MIIIYEKNEILDIYPSLIYQGENLIQGKQ